ncbi:MAG TPA: CYTH and CHAD domain-containing protein [Gaiella sp.]|nr:CYTH and CHAD domain-containing protein [Gaiella sp.]
MKQAVEREVKLAPGEGFVLPELGGETLPMRRFTSTYHDTPDLALARHGVTLRHRVERGTGVWQLKLPSGAARIELEQPGPPARPPLELSSLLVAFVRGRDVAPVARLRTRRESLRIDGAEIVDDWVSVLEGQRVTRRFRELEVELVGGDERTLRKLAKALRRAGATPSDELRPKLYRALDLAVPPAAAVVPAGTAPAEALGIALGEQVRRLLLHDPGVRLGSDPEDLHQHRVATRRLRAFLRAGRPLLEPSWSESLRDELQWLGRALGPARDRDVMVERLREDVAALDDDAEALADLLAELEAEHAEARRAVVGALSSDRYLELLERLDHVSEPELSGADVPLADVWRAEWRRARKTFAKLDDASADEELHAGRIRVKRARYAAELAEHELGKRSKDFVEAAKHLQDVLGEHQDATVAEARIRAWAADRAGGDAASRLVEREHERKATQRDSWPSAWKALKKAAKPLT